MQPGGCRSLLLEEANCLGWEWEISTCSLPCNLAEVSIPIGCITYGTPSAASTPSLLVSGHACLNDAGALSWYVVLPPGTRAVWGQWVGPQGPHRLRVAADTWSVSEGTEKVRRGRGGDGFWRLEDHADKNGVLILRLAFFCVASIGPGAVPAASQRFLLGGTLGAGTFGSVHAVQDRESGRSDLAAKTCAGGTRCDLLVEVAAMKRMAGVPGFPELLGVFILDEEGSTPTEMVVMQRLHHNLSSLLEDAGRLRPDLVVDVGCQVVARLRDLHFRGLVHRDLKPKNIMFGPDNLLYLVDFGLTRPFRVQETSSTPMFAAPRRPGHVVGTTRFASIPAHSDEHSQRSDLETAAYVLIYAAVGRLPWQGCEAGSKQERIVQLLKAKHDNHLLEQHTRRGLSEHPALAEALWNFTVQCRSLALHAEPEYGQLCEVLALGVGGGPLVDDVAPFEAAVGETTEGSVGLSQCLEKTSETEGKCNH